MSWEFLHGAYINIPILCVKSNETNTVINIYRTRSVVYQQWTLQLSFHECYFIWERSTWSHTLCRQSITSSKYNLNRWFLSVIPEHFTTLFLIWRVLSVFVITQDNCQNSSVIWHHIKMVFSQLERRKHNTIIRIYVNNCTKCSQFPVQFSTTLAEFNSLLFFKSSKFWYLSK